MLAGLRLSAFGGKAHCGDTGKTANVQYRLRTTIPVKNTVPVAKNKSCGILFIILKNFRYGNIMDYGKNVLAKYKLKCSHGDFTETRYDFEILNLIRVR